MRKIRSQDLNIRKIIDFIKGDIWRIRSGTLPPERSFLLKQLRIVILAFHEFDKDKCSLRASALTFFSLLSIVPATALAFGIAKGFALEKLLEKELLERFKGQEEVISRVITFAHSTLEETKGGLIAGIGLAVLFYLIIKLLSNIENSFNDIWGVTRPRSIGRKLSDYLSMMFVCPILLVMSSSITVFIKTQVTLFTQKIALLGGAFSPVISFLLKGLPYCVIWVLFTFVYLFMPNTKVCTRSGLLGGIVAGTIYQVVQWAYITFQIGVGKYGAIYGGFAALPLFLVWLYMSWLIVLFGAEISFASQNVETYEFEPDSLRVKPSFKRLLGLCIAHLSIKNFCDGERPWSAGKISHTLEIPIRLANRILFELVESQILSEVRTDDGGEAFYQPARNIDTLSINYIIHALDNLGSDNIPIAQYEEMDKISDCVKMLREVVERSDANLLLKDI
jgi:membrane protein